MLKQTKFNIPSAKYCDKCVCLCPCMGTNWFTLSLALACQWRLETSYELCRWNWSDSVMTMGTSIQGRF